MRSFQCICSLLLLLLLSSQTPVFGQEEAPRKITIRHADAVKRTVSVVADAQRLLGNVSFLYEESQMYCDSAYYYDSKDFEAWGNIAINQGDSLYLYGDHMFLEYENGLARIDDNIRLVDDQMTLTTDRITYKMDEGLATFYDGGEIRSKKDNNILTSDQGYYLSEEKRFFFEENVILKNPEYELQSDTLQYSTESARAYFFGPTTIKGQSADIYCENGWYDTNTDICQFNANARVISGDKVLEGDSVYYDGNLRYGEVLGNVQISDTTGQFFINGNYGHHFEKQDQSLVTGNAYLTQVFETDSLFMKADTLLAQKDSLNLDLLLGFHNVRIFKSDMQGKCDSLSFSDADSTLTLYNKPILWSDQNQISGDTIALRLYEGTIDGFVIPKNGIIISEAAPNRYNQIQGRRLLGKFSNNDLRKVTALGNGETIYYPTEESDSTITVMGMNRIYCSDIEIYVDSSAIDKINFLDKPSGKMLIPKNVKEEDRLLSGFQWRVDERPMSKAALFEKQKAKEEEEEEEE